MSINEKLAALAGKWKGTNRLFLSPHDDSIKESASSAAVTTKANGQFLAIEYTWSFEDGPQEGLLVLGGDAKSDAAQLVWTDSWHMSHKFMVCDGVVTPDGVADVKGYYAVDGHPDWGWRTQIIPGETSFKLIMFNVSPEGEEALAVETEYLRA